MSVLISNVYLAWKQSLQGNAVWSTITALTAAPPPPPPPIINVTFMYIEATTECREMVDYLLLRNAVYMM